MSQFARTAAALFALACIALPAHAEEPAATRIAVKDFLAKGVEPSTASAVQSLFCTALGEQKLDVLCPEDVAALVKAKQTELGLGSCKDEEECLQQIARFSEAKRVVTGEVSKLGGTFFVNVSLIDPATSKVLVRASEKAASENDLIGIVQPLAKKVASAK